MDHLNNNNQSERSNNIISQENNSSIPQPNTEQPNINKNNDLNGQNILNNNDNSQPNNYNPQINMDNQQQNNNNNIIPPLNSNPQQNPITHFNRNPQEISNQIPPPLNNLQQNNIPRPLYNQQNNIIRPINNNPQQTNIHPFIRNPQQNYLPPTFNDNRNPEQNRMIPPFNYPQNNNFIQNNDIYNQRPYNNFNYNNINQINNLRQPIYQQNSNNYQTFQIRLGNIEPNNGYSDSGGIYSVLPAPQIRNNNNRYQNINYNNNYNIQPFPPSYPPHGWIGNNYPPYQPIMPFNPPYIAPTRNRFISVPFREPLIQIHPRSIFGDDDNHLDNNNNRINELLEDVKMTEETLNKCESKECTICLEEYKIGDNICYLPCFHYFHSNCIKQWTKRSKKCPLCNNEINFG